MPNLHHRLQRPSTPVRAHAIESHAYLQFLTDFSQLKKWDLEHSAALVTTQMHSSFALASFFCGASKFSKPGLVNREVELT